MNNIGRSNFPNFRLSLMANKPSFHKISETNIGSMLIRLCAIPTHKNVSFPLVRSSHSMLQGFSTRLKPGSIQCKTGLHLPSRQLARLLPLLLDGEAHRHRESTDRQTDRQTDRHTHTHTHKHTHTHTHITNLDPPEGDWLDSHDPTEGRPFDKAVNFSGYGPLILLP